jgi:hypothetical protein
MEDSTYLDAYIDSLDVAFRSGKIWFQTISERIQEIAGLVRSAGCGGVVYLFDEVETVATLLSTVRQRLLSYEFLNLLIDGRKHAHCFFAFAASPDFRDNLSSDGAYEWYSGGYPEGFRFIRRWRESLVDVVRLPKCSRSDVLSLCRHLRDYHGEAFMWDVNGRFGDQFLEVFVRESESKSMAIREMIKALVHLLEIAEQHRDVDVECALNFGRSVRQARGDPDLHPTL